jgi:hypothetical protein
MKVLMARLCLLVGIVTCIYSTETSKQFITLYAKYKTQNYEDTSEMYSKGNWLELRNNSTAVKRALSRVHTP